MIVTFANALIHCTVICSPLALTEVRFEGAVQNSDMRTVRISEAVSPFRPVHLGYEPESIGEARLGISHDLT